MRQIRLAGVLTLAALLAGCGHNQTASVLGGEAHALKGPEFEVKGATDFDQRWIDDTVEAGVAALGWQRPAPRPPEWDRPLAPASAAMPALAPKKKLRLRDRLHNLLHRKKTEIQGG